MQLKQNGPGRRFVFFSFSRSRNKLFSRLNRRCTGPWCQRAGLTQGPTLFCFTVVPHVIKRHKIDLCRVQELEGIISNLGPPNEIAEFVWVSTESPSFTLGCDDGDHCLSFAQCHHWDASSAHFLVLAQ